MKEVRQNRRKRKNLRLETKQLGLLLKLKKLKILSSIQPLERWGRVL